MTEAGSKPTSDAADRVLDQHQSIREFTARLENIGDLEELLRRLEEFRRMLVPHFLAEEDRDGLYDVIRSFSPRQLSRVDQLQREHEAITADIDRVAARARACLAGPVAEVLAEARVLARRVRKHESSENSMLLDAMYTDLGQGD